MIRRTAISLSLLAVAGLLALSLPAHAQQKQSHAYLLQVMTGDGKGYLPMAEAEVQTALIQATLALRKPDDLAHLQAQARAAQHAIDPSRIKEGPGRGFGVRKAAEGVVSYVTATGKSPDASEKIRSYSRWVAVSAENVIVRADRITDLLGKVERMKTAKNAARVMHLVRPHVSGNSARQGHQQGRRGQLEEARRRTGPGETLYDRHAAAGKTHRMIRGHPGGPNHPISIR